MATYTATFTINANDDGTLSSYQYYAETSYTIPQSMNNNSLVDDMDMMKNGLESFGGTVSYTLSGSGTWLSETVVTFTIVDPTFIPQFAAITTENYYYTLLFIANDYCTPTVCSFPYYMTLTACESFYNFELNLDSGTIYWMALDNGKHKRYVQPISADINGNLNLWSAAPEFPTGYFTPYNVLTVKIYSDQDLTNQVSFTINNTTYQQINLDFIYTIITSD